MILQEYIDEYYKRKDVYEEDYICLFVLVEPHIIYKVKYAKCIRGKRNEYLEYTTIIDGLKRNYDGIPNSATLRIIQNVIPVYIGFECESHVIKIVTRVQDNKTIWLNGRWLV